MSATVNSDAEASPTKGRMGFRPDIEGLRAVAILMVVADHLGVRGFKGGFVGVDVFFVISGFLITGLLADERAARAERGSKAISLRGFYARRARRILPAALTVIAVVLLVAKLDFNFIRFGEVQADAFWATFFAANLHLMHQATDYFAINRTLSPLQNYWSLAVEEQFYLVWPLLLIGATGVWVALKERGSRIKWDSLALGAVTVLGIASFIWALIACGDSPVVSYYSPFTRAWQLALGAALALWTHRRAAPSAGVAKAAGLIGLGLILLGLLLITPKTAIPGAMALLPTVGAALLLWGGGTGATPTDSVLSLRPVRFIGRISYSLYLWHWPIIVFAGGTAWIERASHPLRAAGLFAFSVGVSWLSWRWIEQPFRKIGRGRQGAPSRKSLVGMATLAAAVGLVLVVFVRPEPSYPQASAALAGVPISNWRAKLEKSVATKTASEESLRLAAAGRKLGPAGCWEVATPKAIAACSLPGQGADGIRWPSGVSRNVVLYGNSYAAQWRQTLAAVLPRGVTLTTVTATACDPVDTESTKTNSGGESCAKTARFALAEVARLRPALVVFSMAVVRNRSKTAEFFKAIRINAGHVLWIGVAPAAHSFERCLGRGNELTACNATSARARLGAAFDLSFGGLAADAGAGYVGLTDVYCFADVCPAIVAGQPIRTDGSHLSIYGMRAAVPKLSLAIALQIQ
jgi:peptidoglycan/LPS O-acetylase OafA/YrhL